MDGKGAAEELLANKLRDPSELKQLVDTLGLSGKPTAPEGQG
jgi:hypothetical protein